jgi:hypothetical protein
MESGANFRANSRDAATPKSGIRKEKCRVEVQTRKRDKNRLYIVANSFRLEWVLVYGKLIYYRNDFSIKILSTHSELCPRDYHVKARQ